MALPSSRIPNPDFTIVGSKSYGRAPTFLMATGYEQVRSVVAEPSPATTRRRAKSSWCCRRPAFAALTPSPVPSEKSPPAAAAAPPRLPSTPAAWQMRRPRTKASQDAAAAAPLRQKPKTWKPPNERRARLLRPRSGRSASPRSSAMARSSTATASSRQPSRPNSPGRSNGCLPSSRHRCWRARSSRPFAGRWADRFGAGRLMVPGSIGGRAALAALCAGAGAPRLCRWRAGDGTRLLLRALQHGVRGDRAVGRPQRAAQHHPPHADRRVCIDPVLAADHDAARAFRLARDSRHLRRAQSRACACRSTLARAPSHHIDKAGHEDTCAAADRHRPQARMPVGRPSFS